MRKKTRKVFGVGVNDVPWSVKVDGTHVPYYVTWHSMMRRCYSDVVHKRLPTYIDCFVSHDWVYLSDFYEWWCEQDWQPGWQLDKDIILRGNKMYSPDYCVFVERRLNSFLVWQDRDHGDLPKGVSWHSRDLCYSSSITDVETNRQLFLGYFDTAEEAHHVFNTEKWKQAKVWINRVESSPHYKKKDKIIASLTDLFKYEV